MLLRNNAAHDEIVRNMQIDCFEGDKLWKVVAEKYVDFYNEAK